MKIELPQSWEHITIGQFIAINKAKESGLDDLELIVEILSIVSGVERQKIEQLNLTSIRKAYSALSFMESEKMPDKVSDRLKIKGIDYRCDFNIKKITAGQYIDFKNFAKDTKNNIHFLLACLYIPVGKKYNEKSVLEIAEDFLDLPITIAYPAAVFFWTLYGNWIEIIQSSFQKEMRKSAMKMITR